MIEEAPLQLYLSALVFAPLQSLVRETFIQVLPDWLCPLLKIRKTWGNDFLILDGHSKPVCAVAFCPDSSIIASSASNDASVRLWNVNTGEAKSVLKCEDISVLRGYLEQLQNVAFTPDGLHLAVASRNRTVGIWSFKTGVLCRVLECLLHSVTTMAIMATMVAFSPDGRFLASATTNKSLMLWNYHTGTPCTTLSVKPDDIIESVAFSCNSQSIVSISTGERGRVEYCTADLNDRCETASLERSILAATSVVTSSVHVAGDEVRTVALSLDGLLVAIASSSRYISLWRAASRNALYRIESPGYCAALAFSPDGKLLASGHLSG
jgi:WD40 repeat protein